MLSKKQKSRMMQKGGGLPASMPTLSDMNIGLAIPGVFPTAAKGGYRKKSHKSKKNKKSKSRSKSNRRSRKNRK